jgi:MFS family permease
MMSLINTNEDYLSTMDIEEESPIVGVIVAVYYLGTAVGAVFFSWLADKVGRKKSIFFSLATASLGNLIMFVAGFKFQQIALWVMLAGRVIMGLGVGGIDAVIPTYSSELSSDDSRGKALAQEFQSNIFGLVMAFGLNLGVTIALGTANQWAWRIPIIVMQVYPVVLMALVGTLPESPRWFVFNDKKDEAKKALEQIYGDEGKQQFDELVEAHDKEQGDSVGYFDMLNPYHPQFHPTMVTIMGQINQALTGYGAVSVYGPQIFQASLFRSIMKRTMTDHTAASWLRHSHLGVHYAWQLHLILLPDDARLAAHRCHWPAQVAHPRLYATCRLFPHPHSFRWSFRELVENRHSSHCAWHSRLHHAFHRDR